jgi:anaerobic selenocysteine-containing dehydrogenase
VLTEVKDGKAVRFVGDPENPVTRGWLCAKVRPYLDHVYHPDRLMYPLRRTGPKGAGHWQRITWDEALKIIAERWQQILRRYGSEAILPYSYSGTLGFVQMAVCNTRLWNRLGASQLERSICGAASERAVEATLGLRWSPPYHQVLRSKLVILWGHNPISTAPHFMPFLRQAQRRGCEVIVIDPRRTPSAKTANQHLAPLPGSDGVLAMGLGHVIVARGLHDESWLAAHTVGWSAFRQRLAEYPPDRVASLTGLSEPDIVSLACRYARCRPSLIKISDGINRNRNGGQNVRVVCALPAITGQYGLRGGGLAYSTSGYFRWKDPLPRWPECPPPGRVVNMNRLGAALLGEIDRPPIMSLFVFGANPAASSPNAGKIVRGLVRDDLFTVVHDLFLTDTADYADLVLPATSQLEHSDLHKAYGHTMLTYNHQAMAPMGECKSNWEVMGLLAKALGFDDPWLYQSPDEIISHYLKSSASQVPGFDGITLDRLKTEGPISLALESETPFANGRFPTPSGRVELFSQALADAGVDPLPGRFREDEDDGDVAALAQSPDSKPLWLITGASHHFVSSSLANQAGLLAGEGSPFLEIHPIDAAERSIRHGDAVIVENGRGSCPLRAVVTDAVRQGVVVSAKGRWCKLSGGRNVNWTTPDVLADMAGQSTFHSNRVWVRRV